MNNYSTLLYAIIIVFVYFINFNNSIPTSDAGIVGDFQSLPIDSKELNKLLDQVGPTINLHRYFYLNKFNKIDNLFGKVKYVYPIFELQVIEAKSQKQFLNLDGNKEVFKQPMYNTRGQQIGFKDFQIGTLYDITLHVDTTIQSSKQYESFLRNQSSTNIIEDYKSKRVLESKCRYLSIKIYKDYLKLVLVKQFICIDSLEQLKPSQHQSYNSGAAGGNSGVDDNGISYNTISTTATNNSNNKNENKLLKVMSYNTWNFNEPWRERRVLMADLIEKESPDIIAFQELRFSHWTSEVKNTNFIKMGEERNQVQQLFKLLGERNQKFNFVYLPSMVYTTNNGLEFEGLSIFSKYPITDFDSIKLSREIRKQEDVHQRSCLRIEVFIKERNLKVNIFTSHFSLDSEGSKRNAFESKNWINSFPKPHLFMGDFNLEPHEFPIQYLIGKVSYQSNNYNNKGVSSSTTTGNDHFIDTWHEFSNHPNQQLIKQKQQQQIPEEGTCDKTDLVNGFTFPTLYGSTNKRIDYLLRSNDSILSVTDFKIVGKCSKTSDHYSQFYASDHTSIVTTFNINN